MVRVGQALKKKDYEGFLNVMEPNSLCVTQVKMSRRHSMQRSGAQEKELPVDQDVSVKVEAEAMRMNEISQEKKNV